MSTRREVLNGRQFDLLATGRKISPMRLRRVLLVVVCTGVCFAGAHLSRAQEATSANLPDQFQTGEMIQAQKAKKKKAEATSQTLATVPTQDTAPVPEHTLPAAEEVPAQIAPAEEKKAEPNRSAASMPPNQKAATPIEQALSGGRVASRRLARRKKTSQEKAAATCCANGGGEHFGTRTNVAFSGTIHGNQRAFARLPVRSETPQPHRKRRLPCHR